MTNRKNIVALIVGGLFLDSLFTLLRHKEFVRLPGWIELLALFFAVAYIYFGGNSKQDRLPTTTNAAHAPDARITEFHVVESVYRLLTLITILWFYDARIFGYHFRGPYLSALPIATLLVIGLHLKAKQMTKWYSISLISSILGLLFLVRELWRGLSLSSTDKLLASLTASHEFSFLIPSAISFSLLFLYLSIIIPALNRATLFGYKFGTLKYDIRINRESDEAIILPLYSAFVYGIIFAGLYRVLLFIVYGVLG